MSDEFAIPTGMVEDCGRLLGWCNAKCDTVVIAYRQFIELVRQFEDWNAIMLLPPPCVDWVWFTHLVQYEKHYVKACQDYCGGNFIRHHCTAINPATEISRMVTTAIAVKARFDKNVVDPEIWSFVDAAGVHRYTYAHAMQQPPNEPKVTQQQQQQERPKSQTTPKNDATLPHLSPSSNYQPEKQQQEPHPDSSTIASKDKITIFLSTEDGQKKPITIPRFLKIGKLFEQFSQRSGIDMESLAFLTNGAQVDPNQSPAALKLRYYDTITVVTIVKFLVCSPQLSQELPVKMKRSTPMGVAMDHYRQRNRIPRTRAVQFFTRSGPIGRDETPKSLGLKNGVEIIVMLLKKES
jgi:hypothetical protein